ncbi:MAG: glycosyltransferase [Alphaproteobacteria bacterium]|nr:glycosyltransferase [Alphaproteobacteria bacterium]
MSLRKFDIVVVGDFRFPGGTSSSLVEEIRIQAASGYRTGLIHLHTSFLRAGRALHSGIGECVNDGLAEILDPREPIDCQLAILSNPLTFLQPLPVKLNIRAKRKIMVAHQPPKDANSLPYYEPMMVHGSACDLVGPGIVWAPTGPHVRKQFEGDAASPPLLQFDWINVIDPKRWSTRRPAVKQGRLVIGRHSRPEKEKWPHDRELAVLAWPDDHCFDVRFLGVDNGTRRRYKPIPPNWTIHEFGDLEVRAFLEQLHVFVYYHHISWVEAFGRNILEAMAAGLPCILPPHFETVFGDAAVYADIYSVPDLLERLLEDGPWRKRLGQVAAQRAAERFGPQVHLSRLEALIDRPARTRRSPATPRNSHSQRPLFFTSNGIGVGHLTRLMAIARRLEIETDPVFVTMSQGLSVVESFGFLCEYLPFHAYLECDPIVWNRQLTEELEALIDFHGATCLVFDGNMPYEALVRLKNRRPDLNMAWCRRSMWEPGAGKVALQRQSIFDLLIEPRDIADERDRGLTVEHRSNCHRVNPIMLLDPEERLSRSAARAVLGLRNSSIAVLILLGAGNNQDYGPVLKSVQDVLLAHADVQVCFVDWIMANRTNLFPEAVLRIREYPVSRFLAAFDFGISTAGYNSFHEIINAGLPTIFVPNVSPGMDNQRARAEFARDRGAAEFLHPADPDSAPRLIARMMNPVLRSDMREACREVAWSNGAVQAARLIASMAQVGPANLTEKRCVEHKVK